MSDPDRGGVSRPAIPPRRCKEYAAAEGRCWPGFPDAGALQPPSWSVPPQGPRAPGVRSGGNGPWPQLGAARPRERLFPGRSPGLCPSWAAERPPPGVPGAAPLPPATRGKGGSQDGDWAGRAENNCGRCISAAPAWGPSAGSTGTPPGPGESLGGVSTPERERGSPHRARLCPRGSGMAPTSGKTKTW